MPIAENFPEGLKPLGKISDPDGNFHIMWGPGKEKNIDGSQAEVFADADVTAAYQARGEEQGPLGVSGTMVAVDWDSCVADGACIEACPVGVYEWFDSPGNPASDKKPLMSKEPDCIFCLACEGVCPPQAIKIFEQK